MGRAKGVLSWLEAGTAPLREFRVPDLTSSLVLERLHLLHVALHSVVTATFEGRHVECLLDYLFQLFWNRRSLLPPDNE